jgi:hypothetical protein
MEEAPNKARREFEKFGTSKVVGVINDKAQVDTTRVALNSIGITDAMIEVFCGLEGERNLDLKGESHGFLDHVLGKSLPLWNVACRHLSPLRPTSHVRVYSRQYSNGSNHRNGIIRMMPFYPLSSRRRNHCRALPAGLL